MTNLRLLQINDVQLTGSYEYLSKELKWLCWHKCPMEFLPHDFHLENLVILDMQHSKVKQVWKKKKIFNKLKVLNLSNSKFLTRSPDFSQVPQLEILILEGCTSLIQVHKSIGHLKRLVLLNLENCTNLKYLPRSIFNLESLETLDLSGCSAFENLPNQQPSSFRLFMNLKTASFSGCSSLIELPNFLHAPHLKSLKLKGCTSLVQVHESIGHLKRLVFLNLKNCTKLKYLPRSIFYLESLETLNFSGCSAFEKLPDQQPSSFGILMNLKTVSFSGCSSLIELPNFLNAPCLESSSLIELPNFLNAPCLESLEIEGCTSLVEIHESIGLLKRLVWLNLRSCEKLKNLPNSISNLESLETLDLKNCFNLENLPEQLGNMTALKNLEVSYTAIKQPPFSFRLLRNIEDVSFRGCQCLIESPEFSQSSRLKYLRFQNCTSLVKIHESIRHLKRLKLLDLGWCKKLRGLPTSNTSNLESLESLLLSNYSELDNLPEQCGNMMALSEFDASGTAIEQIPLSFGLLSRLSVLRLPGCGGLVSPQSSNRISLLSISKLCLLTTLDLSCNNLSEDEIPIEFECLSLLEELDLSRNKFCNQPSFISRLPKLLYLYLNECTTLRSISLPRSAMILEANHCTSLGRISVMTNESSKLPANYQHLKSLSSDLDNLDDWPKMMFAYIGLDNCHKLVEIQNLESLLRSPGSVRMGSCNNLSSDFRESVLLYFLKTMCGTIYDPFVLLPGSEIPNWISHQAIGSSISFRVPPLLEGKIRMVLFCVVYGALAKGGLLSWKWRFRNKSSRDQSNNWYDLDNEPFPMVLPAFDIFEDHIYALKIMWTESLQLKSGDEIEFAVNRQMRRQGIDSLIMEVKRCGIHLWDL